MPARYNLPLPAFHVLIGGYTIIVDAIDPATGDTVPGVDVSEVHLQVDNIGGTDLGSGDFVVQPPLLTHEPQA